MTVVLSEAQELLAYRARVTVNEAVGILAHYLDQVGEEEYEAAYTNALEIRIRELDKARAEGRKVM